MQEHAPASAKCASLLSISSLSTPMSSRMLMAGVHTASPQYLSGVSNSNSRDARTAASNQEETVMRHCMQHRGWRGLLHCWWPPYYVTAARQSRNYLLLPLPSPRLPQSPWLALIGTRQPTGNEVP